MPQITQAMASSRSHYMKKGISQSATLPSRMRSHKEAKKSVKDLFDVEKEPTQGRHQRGSEEVIPQTGQDQKDSSSYFSQYSSSTSLPDQESGYGSSGNQDNHQRYPSTQLLHNDQQANRGEKTNKFKVLTRNRSSSTVPADKWHQKSRMASTSDTTVTNTLPKVHHQDREGAEANTRRALSVTPVPRRKAPPAPGRLTPSPSPKSPLCSPLASRKQSAPTVTVPNGSALFALSQPNFVPTSSKVSPEIQRRGGPVTRGLSLPVTDHGTTAFPFADINPSPVASPTKSPHQVHPSHKSVPSSPHRNGAVPIHPTSPGPVTPVSRNPDHQLKKIAPLTSPTHVRPRLNSHEATTPTTPSALRQRTWSRSSDEDGHKHAGHGRRLSRHSFSESKPSPKTTSKRKDSSSESRGRSGSMGHKSRTSNQILKQSGVNAVMSSQRNKLLVSIRQGKQLRKVQQKKQQFSQQGAMPWDVAAILERRQIMEFSDNEHEDGAVDENEWEEN